MSGPRLPGRAAGGEEQLPSLLSAYAHAPDALARSLGRAQQMLFEASWRCELGEPADGRAREVWLHPPDDLFVGRLRLGLAGRTRRAVGWRAHRRARRMWTSGLISVDGTSGWIPADCWSERVFAEAGRRLVMATLEGARMLGELPELRCLDAWAPPAGDAVAAEVGRMRAAAEDDVFFRWWLNDLGRRRFELFARDPDRPLA